MVIDCSRCVMQDIACHDCVVTVLLGPVGEFDDAERTALAVLADGGLVPPLRLVAPEAPAAPDGPPSGRRAAVRTDREDPSAAVPRGRPRATGPSRPAVRAAG